jgi:hypothetical protein
MTEDVRAIHGDTLQERLVNLAGALAERGARELIVADGERETRLVARETDLPGELEAAIERAPANAVTVIAPTIGVRAAVSRHACSIAPL